MSPVLAGVDKGSDTMREGYWGGVNSGNGGNNSWRVVSDNWGVDSSMMDYWVDWSSVHSVVSYRGVDSSVMSDWVDWSSVHSVVS